MEKKLNVPCALTLREHEIQSRLLPEMNVLYKKSEHDNIGQEHRDIHEMKGAFNFLLPILFIIYIYKII